MRSYEIVYIVKTDVSEEDLDKLISQMDGLITNNGGTIQKTEKWGRRRLAYEVRGQREGQGDAGLERTFLAMQHAGV